MMKLYPELENQSHQKNFQNEWNKFFEDDICKLCQKNEKFIGNKKRHIKNHHTKHFNEEEKGPTGKIDRELDKNERKLYLLEILRITLEKSLPFSTFCESTVFLKSQKILNSTITGISIDMIKKTLKSVIKKMKCFIKGNYYNSIFR